MTETALIQTLYWLFSDWSVFRLIICSICCCSCVSLAAGDGSKCVTWHKNIFSIDCQQFDWCQKMDYLNTCCFNVYTVNLCVFVECELMRLRAVNLNWSSGAKEKWRIKKSPDPFFGFKNALKVLRALFGLLAFKTVNHTLWNSIFHNHMFISWSVVAIVTRSSSTGMWFVINQSCALVCLFKINTSFYICCCEYFYFHIMLFKMFKKMTRSFCVNYKEMF